MSRLAEERVITEYIMAPPLAMYDIGVGPGTEARTLKGFYPSMKVYGCEPSPDEAVDFPGILHPSVAIGEVDGHGVLYLGGKDSGQSVLHLPNGRGSVEVEVWTLDTFDHWACKPDRILLWMDIEGSELAALRGGKKLMESGRVLWVNLELCVGGDRPQASEVHQYMESIGYERLREYNHHGSHWDAIYRRSP